MEWFNNQWVIGIGTSIVSGFLVFFFTRKFFTERQKKEYNQKIRTANNEILYAIRPLIVEKTKPSVDILDSVFFSTARKYGVELRDIYDKETLCDDLTNEIMSNSFLASEQKMELTEMINALKSERKDQQKEKIVTIYRDSKSNSSTYMAMLLSIMTAMTALIFTIYKGVITDDGILGSTSDKFDSIKILALVLLIPVMALTVTTMLKFMREGENSRTVKKLDEKKGQKEESTPPNKD